MVRVLCIDNDEMIRQTLNRLLTFHGYRFIGASTGRDGIRLAREFSPDVAFVELRLPDMSGLDVLGWLAAECPVTARILFTGFATVDAAVKTMRLGTWDCVAKPSSQQEIVDAVQRALPRPPCRAGTAAAERMLPPLETHAATRWADPINRAIGVPRDPRTLRELCAAVFVSVGCFRNWCRTTRVGSRESLAFARALRVVYRFERDPSTRPENLLSIVDRRTIAKFVKKCGGTGDRLPDSVHEFLDRQQFIANREALEAIRTALTGSDGRTIESATVPDSQTIAADNAGEMKGTSGRPATSTIRY